MSSHQGFYGIGAAAAVSSSPARNPVVLIPGYLGSLAKDDIFAQLQFGYNRGIAANQLQLVPAYQNVVSYLESRGYQQGTDLFVLPYDWRIPLAIADSQKDGQLSNVTAATLTDGVIKSQVDYLGEFLKWLVQKDSSIKAIDVLAHSNGNNVTRAYVQSAGYGGAFPLLAGSAALPVIDKYVQIAAPSEGAALAWNVWQNNLQGIAAFGGKALDFVNQLKTLYSTITPSSRFAFGATIKGPDIDISRKTILDGGGAPSPLLFVQQYFASLQTLNPTYDFLFDVNGKLGNINADPVSGNAFLQDLNALSTPGVNPWVQRLGKVYATYGVTLPTVTQAQTRVGPGGEVMSVATGKTLIPTVAGQTWFEDLPQPMSGDSVVPLVSLQSTYLNDPNITVKPWGNPSVTPPTPAFPFTPTDAPVDHTNGILVNPDVWDWITGQLLTTDRSAPELLAASASGDGLKRSLIGLTATRFDWGSVSAGIPVPPAAGFPMVPGSGLAGYYRSGQLAFERVLDPAVVSVDPIMLLFTGAAAGTVGHPLLQANASFVPL